jgi:hypothetical protein
MAIEERINFDETLSEREVRHRRLLSVSADHKTRNFIVSQAVELRNSLPSYLRENLDECDCDEGMS